MLSLECPLPFFYVEIGTNKKLEVFFVCIFVFYQAVIVLCMTQFKRHVLDKMALLGRPTRSDKLAYNNTEMTASCHYYTTRLLKVAEKTNFVTCIKTFVFLFWGPLKRKLKLFMQLDIQFVDMSTE